MCVCDVILHTNNVKSVQHAQKEVSNSQDEVWSLDILIRKDVEEILPIVELQESEKLNSGAIVKTIPSSLCYCSIQ